jgi:two-component system, OmpR family, sensor histidine kinase KdpD
MAESPDGAARASLTARIQGYGGALAMVAVSTLISLWIAPRWGAGAVDMIYLPAVLATAVWWGLGPALAAGIAAALAYNFFFSVPVHTFRMDRVTDIVTVVVLLIVALVTSKLAAGIRAQARLAAGHAKRNATIAGFARRLLSCSTEQEIASTACAELRRLFDCNAMLVSGVPEPRIVGADPAGNRLTPSDLAAAALAIDSGEPAGRGTSRSQPAEWLFHPVRIAGGVIAAVGLARDDGHPPLAEERLPLLDNLLDQLALALERERLGREARLVAETRDRDRLRASLLSSIVEELKPRLAAIGSAARQLQRNANGDRDTVSTIASEIMRLDRYVETLADLEPEAGQQPIDAGPVRIDLHQRSVSRDGEQVHLTPKEYALLAELARQSGRVLTHSQLLRSVWGPAQERQIDYLRVAIRALRQKLEDEPSQPRLIVNEPGVGYRLIAG